MKKSTIILVAVIAALAMWVISAYNGMVKMDESVSTAWSNVENQYQRRTDLIPNLVNTVKGYAAHEKETFEAVVSARSKATQMTVDPENLTPEKLQEYQKAQGEIGAYNLFTLIRYFLYFFHFLHFPHYRHNQESACELSRRQSISFILTECFCFVGKPFIF